MNYFTNKILLFALALLIYIPVAVSAVEKREHAIIEGYFPEYDTLKVKFTIFKNGISTVAEGATTREISSTNGHFKMRLPVKGAVTVGVEVSADGRIKHAFMTWGKYSTTTLLIEEGDSVLIRRDPNTEGWEHNSLLFSGRGSEKMTAVKDLINKRIAYISRFDKEHPMGLEDGIDWMDTLRILTIEEINRYGESLSPYARTYLQTEVFEGLTNAASLYRALIERGREDTLVRRLYYERIVKQPFIRDPEDFDILRSSIYKATLRDKALLDYMMETGIAFTDSYGKEHREEWYHALESAYTGTLRDNLLAYYLIAYSRKRGFEQDMQLKSCVELFLATTNRQSTYHQIVGDIYDLFA
ncbi:MAG TPA: hypothetical protein VNQ55_00665, partial [Parapedobacter sp.]|nr:hypothetical protein [Parapedobacter sp.]